MINVSKNFLLLGLLFTGQLAFAQCDPTLSRPQLVTCLMNQQQSQTGVMPHQSQFNNLVPIYQSPAPAYQSPAPIYQPPALIYQSPALIYQPPSPWIPSNRSSTYR